MKRIALGIQYDGSAWQGWQTQPHGCTVQDHLETALAKFTLQKITTHCAGRTDAGVHALEQVVHFDIDLVRESFSWVRGINSFLPPSIAVRWACEVLPDGLDADGYGGFHARFSARARCYQYVLYNHPIRSPLMVGKAGWVFRPLDVDLMRQAAQSLIGNHDFSAFRAAQCQAKTPVKLMHGIDIVRHGDVIVFSLRASAFLHHMVRNIVGSLIFVGTGAKPPAWMGEVLLGCDRNQAAPTFMPDGLYLASIDYESKWGLPQRDNGALPWF